MESTPRRQCRRLLQPPLDHVVTALLTAALMDVIGGVVNVDLRQDQVQIVADLPGVIATTTGPRPQSRGRAARLPAPTPTRAAPHQARHGPRPRTRPYSASQASPSAPKVIHTRLPGPPATSPAREDRERGRRRP
ncbi:DUF6368 family protein [Streptomyces zhihengii]